MHLSFMQPVSTSWLPKEICWKNLVLFAVPVPCLVHQVDNRHTISPVDPVCIHCAVVFVLDLGNGRNILDSIESDAKIRLLDRQVVPLLSAFMCYGI